MRVCSLILAFLVLVAVSAFGNSTITMGMSPNPPYYDGCTLSDDSGLLTFFVVHWPNPDVTGASYRISRCNSTLTWLSETFYFENVTGIGSGGVVVDYGACLNGPILVQSVTYFGDGTSPASALKILAHPESPSGNPEGFLCGGGIDYPESGGICIKSASCQCNYLGPPYHNIPCDESVPVKTTTWGSVKALYR